MGYRTPTDAPVSDSWWGHKSRNPPSAEPGTDYACSYGTDIRVADGGVVSVIDRGNGGGEGRRLSIDLYDGRRVSYLHLSGIADNAYIGQPVVRGQTAIMWSGASGNGSDWYYGPHVHVSLWERPGMAYAATIDFENYLGESEDEDMTPEQDNRLKHVENLLAVAGAGYGWPQVAGQAAQESAAAAADIQRRIAVPDAGYDWLPAINNKIDPLWAPLIASLVASGLALVGVVVLLIVTLNPPIG